MSKAGIRENPNIFPIYKKLILQLYLSNWLFIKELQEKYIYSFKIEPYRKNLLSLDFPSSESVELLPLLNLALYKVSTDLLYFSDLTTILPHVHNLHFNQGDSHN